MKAKYDDLRREELIALLQERDTREASGLRLTYEGQTPPWQIVRRVKPRRQRIEKRLSHGKEQDQSNNLLVEGENLRGSARVNDQSNPGFQMRGWCLCAERIIKLL